jgi:metal-responsive CopG/Arc/MetJ family transcriptional regulator
METIEVPVDESLIAEVDRVTRSLAMTRADFARAALELALRHQKTIELEQQHLQGYVRHPAKADEIAEWESEQVWGDA